MDIAIQKTTVEPMGKDSQLAKSFADPAAIEQVAIQIAKAKKPAEDAMKLHPHYMWKIQMVTNHI